MNIKSLSVFAAAALALTTVATAAPKTYQVTDPVLEVTDSMIAVQKGSERWEIVRDASTKGEAVKVGDRVTIRDSMTATQVEVKSGDKAEGKQRRPPPAQPRKSSYRRRRPPPPNSPPSTPRTIWPPIWLPTARAALFATVVASVS